MEKENRDEIIEELWNVKDELASSCNQDMEQIVKKMNKIARNVGFKDNQISQHSKGKGVSA